MAEIESNKSNDGKFTGVPVELRGLGRMRLSTLMSEHGETSVYRVDHPGVVVKMFDLQCGKADEVSYGPYVAFNLEKENFQDIDAIGQLQKCVPRFYGANIDYEKKQAYIAMEFLNGENLMDWCQASTNAPFEGWTDQLRAAIYETLTIVTKFHEHGIVLIDFKPDNVIRLPDGRIKFVDLGAFFTPRHSREADKYVYSATPDYAELVIDTSNVQTGIPLSQSSDIFAAGVALFEMTTGRSRLAIADATGDQLLALPELYRFRDTQIKDVWHAYPHLKELLPRVETQLRQRSILFSEIWYLVKALLTHEVPDWETLAEDERHRLILETGTTLITEQLPAELNWLAEAIARATTLRSMRLQSVAELMQLVANPISENVRDDILNHSELVRYIQDLGLGVDFVTQLNGWEVKFNEPTGHWAVLVHAACSHLRDIAAFTCLKRGNRDRWGHSFFHIVSDTDADAVDGKPVTMESLEEDRSAWIGG